MGSTLISSRKVGGSWTDLAPNTGTPFDDCHDTTVQYPGWYEDPPGTCHYYTVEETQRRCFRGHMTRQKYVEIWADTYEVDDGESAAARAGAYSAAGGTVILSGVAAYAFFASNPIGWVVGAGLTLGTILAGGGTILWVESDRFVTRRTELRTVDSGMQRNGFSGTYSVEIVNVRILGNPAEAVPCGDPRIVQVRQWMAATRPTVILEGKGRRGSQSDYTCDESFARGG